MAGLKQRIINLFLSKLFPVVDMEKVLTVGRQGQLYLGGTKIDSKKLADLQQELRMLRNTGIWDILTNTLKHQAQVTMFNKSQDYQDLMNGKMILYTIDVQEKMIQKIDKAK